MPILRQQAVRFHAQCISSMTFTSAHLYGNVYMWVGMARMLANFGLPGEKVPPNGRFPVLDADEPPCKI